MIAKDLHDIGQAAAWLAAVEADLHGLEADPVFRGPENVRATMLQNLSKAQECVERVALGTNRRAAVAKGRAT